MLGTAAMLMPLLLLAVGAIHGLVNSTEILDEVVEEAFEEQEPVLNLEKLVMISEMEGHDFLFYHSDGELASYLRAERDVESAFKGALAAPFGDDEESRLVRKAFARWSEAHEALMAYSRGDETVPPRVAAERFTHGMRDTLGFLGEIKTIIRREIEDNVVGVYASEMKLMFFTIVVFILGLAAFLAAGISLARSVLRPVGALKESVGRFAAGDFAHRVEVTSGNELGELGAAFNNMAGRLQRVQTELEDMSILDGLTGLFNHREFYRLLSEEHSRAIRYGYTYSVMMIDADNFKDVNDSCGHLAGDQALLRLATLVKKCVRDTDKAARYGGDEIAVIMPGTGEAGALAIAARIREALDSEAIAGCPQDPEKEMKLSVSIGVAEFTVDMGSEYELVRKADEALFTAKKAGRNQIVGSVRTPLPGP